MKEGLTRLNADVETETTKKLKIALIEDGMNFSDWLRGQIDCYLKGRKGAKHVPKGKRA